MKVSIIVPVYRAEKYIRRCLDSIVAQTMTDWECILVDDGSPDRSGEICDEYAQKDRRFRVIHQENGGVAAARQCGLNNAKGAYIIYIDPDDWVEPDMVIMMYEKAEKNKADMVFADYFVNTKSRTIYITEKPLNTFHLTILSCILMYKIHGGVCTKLLRKDVFKKYNISFPNLSMTEDTYVMSKILLNDIKIEYIQKAFYHYVKDANPNSLTKTVKQYYKRLSAFYDLLHNSNYGAWLLYLGYRWNWLSYDILVDDLLGKDDFKKYFCDLKKVEKVVLMRDMNWRAKINMYIVLLAVKHYHIGRCLARSSRVLTKLIR